MDHDERHEALEEVDANLSGAASGLQALLEMLAGCEPEHQVHTGPLRTLLLPMADQLEQAVPVVRRMLGEAAL